MINARPFKKVSFFSFIGAKKFYKQLGNLEWPQLGFLGTIVLDNRGGRREGIAQEQN